MNAKRLAPTLAMLNVISIDSELHFVIQVIPATTARTDPVMLPTDPYQVRRSYEDFQAFHALFVEKLQKEFVVTEGVIQHPILGRINEMPRLPEPKQYADYKTHQQRVKELNQYVKHLLLLQPEIYRRAPVPEFFGEWPKDTKAKDRTIPALNGTYDLDILVGNSPGSAYSNMSPLPNPSPPSNSSATPPILATPLPPNNNVPAPEPVKPTFEEFVNDLAKNLGVERTEPKGRVQSMDTVVDSPHLRHKVQSVQSVATVLENPPQRKFVKPMMSMDTVKSAQQPIRTLSLAKSMDTVRDTVLERRDTVLECPISPSLTKISEVSSPLRSEFRDTIVEDLDGRTLTRLNREERDTVIDDVRPNSTKSDSTAVNEMGEAIESYKDRRAVAERLRGHQRQRSNGSLRKEDIPRRQNLMMKIDTTIDRGGSPSPGIAIPSRKESRNWNSSGESPAPKQLNIFTAGADTPTSVNLPFSHSPMSERFPSLGREKANDKIDSLPRDRTTVVKESLGTLARATKRRESPTRTSSRDELFESAMDTIKRGTAKRMNQSAPESFGNNALEYQSIENWLTLRVVLSQCQPLYLPVLRDINYDTLMDKISVLIAETPSNRRWRMLPHPRQHMVALQHVSYRNPDLDLVMIQTERDWDICKYHAQQIEKLTLFVTVHEHK
jgi:hypothetical protein